DRGQVAQHRILRATSVPRLDRRQDAAVVLQGELWTAGDGEGLLAALGQQLHQGPDDPCDGSVAGRLRDRGVERGVRPDPGPAGRDLGALLLDDAPEVADLV